MNYSDNGRQQNPDSALEHFYLEEARLQSLLAKVNAAFEAKLAFLATEQLKAGLEQNNA